MIKIVWIVNIAMADACLALGRPAPVIGGWLTGYQNALFNAMPQAELHIIAPYWGNVIKTVQNKNGKNDITHHLFPNDWIEASLHFTSASRHRILAVSNRMATYFSELFEEINPDIVHLHGIEAPHALAWVEANGCSRTVASIQGIAFEYAKCFMSGLTKKEQVQSFSDWRHGFSLSKEQKKMERRGLSEIALLRKIEHVAGRTQWDHDCVLPINSKLKYHILQEVLRKEFYDNASSWSNEKCHSHTILIGQSHYPIKGVHQVIKALPALIERFPDLRVRIVGHDLTNKSWWQRSTYGNVLYKLVNKKTTNGHKVKEHITYLGSVNASEMVRELQLANVFICPSSIENSCNSVCEAQIIGTPVIAANVGGIPTLIDHNKTGMLYDFNDVDILVSHITLLFNDVHKANDMSNAASTSALLRHDTKSIENALIEIYNEVQYC